MIKSFRGKLASTDIRRIRLSTNDGLTGYKIVKFELLGVDGNNVYEAQVQVYSVKPSAATNLITFEDPTLLAAGIYQDSSTNGILGDSQVVFDNMIINQDIFITYKETASSTAGINYHLELEQVKLDLSEATVATLKDMRGRE
jgi:hypothetical protein